MIIIKIAICDDDDIQIKYISALVGNWAEKSGLRLVISTFSSAEAFEFSWSEDKSYDILLLDIQMQGQNGMELAKAIRRTDSKIAIIFITGFSEYMDEGYDVDALHYLLKPVKEEKLFSVLDKALSKSSVSSRSVVFHTANGEIRIPADDILYAEAFSHTIDINALHQVYTLKISMRETESKLDGGFFRCHRSYIVNLKYVCRVTRTSMMLDNGKEIPLSRRLYDQANQAFIRYNYSNFTLDGK